MTEIEERLAKFNAKREARMKATDSVLQKTKEKFDETSSKLELLYRRKENIEKEIQDLERKQTNRLRFFESSKEKEEKN